MDRGALNDHLYSHHIYKVCDKIFGSQSQLEKVCEISEPHITRHLLNLVASVNPQGEKHQVLWALGDVELRPGNIPLS